MSEHSELKNYQDVLFPTVGQWSEGEGITAFSLVHYNLIIIKQCAVNT